MRTPRSTLPTLLALSLGLTFAPRVRAQPVDAAPPQPLQPLPTLPAPGAPAAPEAPPAPGPGAPTQAAPGVPAPAAPGAPALTIEERLRQLEAQSAADAERRKADAARIKKLEDAGGGIMKNLTVQGYVQVQFLAQSFNKAASPNVQSDGALPPGVGSNDVVAKADGTTTNSTLFRLRRTRLRVRYEVDFMRVFIQIDPLPAGGPSASQGTIVRNAEATGILRWTDDVRTEVGAGLFEVPFRFELLESSMYRPFIERSWLSQSIFPTERDIGVHAKTIAFKDKLVAEVGMLNGQRLGEPRFTELADLSRAKDFVGRVAYKLGPVTLGAFGYVGRGQNVDGPNLRLKTYPRWGANFGATFQHKIFAGLGETRAYAELMFGENMDTGVRYAYAKPAIPADSHDDVVDLKGRGFYLRGEQDFGEHVFAGYRYDTYSPNTSLENNARDTHTLMAGAKFTKLLRIVNEASYIIDNVHPATALAPSKHIFQYSLWMQGSFY
jgi:hypothetical protein